MSLEQKKQEVRKEITKTLKSLPRYQGVARAKIDIDDSFTSMKKAGMSPRMAAVGRTKVEAGIDVDFENGVTAHITRSTMQIFGPSVEDVQETARLFETQLRFMPGAAQHICLGRIDVPPLVVQEKLFNLAHDLLDNPQQVVPALKRALDPYLKSQ